MSNIEIDTKSEKELSYSDALKSMCNACSKKPVVIAYLDENNIPTLSLGNFQLNDLTFMKYLINKHIDLTLEKSLILEKP